MKKAFWGFLAALLVLIPFAFWLSQLIAWETVPTLHDLFRLFALEGFVIVFIQFSLGTKPAFLINSLGIKTVLGTHRTAGSIALLLLMVHGIGILIENLIYSGSVPTVLFMAIVALLLFIVGAGSAAMAKKLKLKFKTWKRVHYVVYLAYVMGFLHSSYIGTSLNSSITLMWFWRGLMGVWLILVILRIVSGVTAKK